MAYLLNKKQFEQTGRMIALQKNCENPDWATIIQPFPNLKSTLGTIVEPSGFSGQNQHIQQCLNSIEVRITVQRPAYK
ncbi:MAG: hypothetical protein V7L05_22615 [Nostoc sp.]|uniref:hypothetical protein n=1 Tax=Nostoc sp. TaxID=1180 RepID=UPI002FF9D09B